MPLAQIARLSLEQHRAVLQHLLSVPSGGLMPVLLVVAMLRTIQACYRLTWQVEWQGINVADKAAQASGDVTVCEGEATLLAIEVTERSIERSRVVATFNTKIVQAGIADYLFVHGRALPAEDARSAAATYFSQGHEINFVQVDDWIIHNLATLGARCRGTFIREMLRLLESRDVPATVKMAWNDAVRGVVGATA